MECDNRSPKIASIYLGLIHTEVAAAGSNADEKMKKMKKALLLSESRVVSGTK
jgi:hypothetical protein